MKKFSSTKTPLALTIAALMSQTSVASDGIMLEEIIVTAQKRVESLQDVPISVAAVGGEKLAEAGINKVADLTAYVPNIHMTETGLSTQLRVRGIGSGNNAGFEQSVGQYIDGIYYGRAQLIRAPFLDLERVEILRGPQGILFGKNSIAGALNMTTAKPTEEFEGEIRASYEPEYGVRELTGVISGALTDDLRARLAYRTYKEDGYIENTFTDKDEPNRDEEAVRLTLAWDVNDDLELMLKAERDTFDVKGRQIEIIQDSAAFKVGAFGDFTGTGFNYSDIMENILGQPGFDSDLDYKRQANTEDSSDNEIYNYTLTANYTWGENTLTLVSGWTGYEYDDICDCDYISTNFFYVPSFEEYDQFSQEVRLVSPGGETVDWIVGAFYQSSDLKTGTELLWPGDSASGTFANQSNLRRNAQETDTWAVFAQATWNITDVTRLTVGARYTEEDKEGTRTATIVASDNKTEITDATILTNWRVRLGTENHDLEGNRSESAFTPTINIQHDLNPDTMIYASASTGFKAGGFDSRANTDASFEFEEEKATTYEIGIKTTFADGAAELNAAYFYTEYDDLQVSQFDGAVGFTVGNAKETVVQGIELDGRWALAEGLVMRYAFAYLDHEYKDYDNGNCYNNQSDPDGDGLCDYTGKSGGYAPKKTGNLGFDYNLMLTDSLELRSSIDAQYVDNHNVHTNLDPQYDIDAYTTVDARIEIESEQWSLALLGKNLTDEEIITFAGNAPLSGRNFGTDTFYGFVKRPRTVAVEAAYRF
ncbi:TonB-dependent receptor [Maricurvus nonylphenolicus]|uniref:TonB-dependent receptor n=1 Tax=Maricurvus nonylphenolicus TaxID=1008307 RepID=UPI0036F1A3B7